MSHKKTIPLIFVCVFLLVLGLIVWGSVRNKASAPTTDTVSGGDQNVPITPVISGDTENLVSFSIAPNATVANGQVVTGSLQGGYFFEANAIGMFLSADKTILKQFPITATGQWMTTDPVSFSVTLDTSGIASGPGYIRIHNDNPSGAPENDKYIDVPVLFP